VKWSGKRRGERREARGFSRREKTVNLNEHFSYIPFFFISIF